MIVPKTFWHTWRGGFRVLFNEIIPKIRRKLFCLQWFEFLVDFYLSFWCDRNQNLQIMIVIKYRRLKWSELKKTCRNTSMNSCNIFSVIPNGYFRVLNHGIVDFTWQKWWKVTWKKLKKKLIQKKRRENGKRLLQHQCHIRAVQRQAENRPKIQIAVDRIIFVGFKKCFHWTKP